MGESLNDLNEIIDSLLENIILNEVQLMSEQEDATPYGPLPSGAADPAKEESRWQDSHAVSLEELLGEALFSKPFQKILSEKRDLIEASGQGSEKNLVASINNLIKANGGQPVALDLGELGSREIKSAVTKGGGNQEPKADISLITTDDESLGISMKKPNFGFFENWVTMETLKDRFTDAGISEKASEFVTDSLVRALEGAVANKVGQIMSEERDAFENAVNKTIDLINANDPEATNAYRKGAAKYKPRKPSKRQNRPLRPTEVEPQFQQFPLPLGPESGGLGEDERLPPYEYGAPIGSGMVEALATLPEEEGYFRKGQKVGKYVLPTIVIPMKKLLGNNNYRAFLNLLIRGPSNMAPDRQAVGVLTANVNSKKLTIQQANDILSNTLRVETVVNNYAGEGGEVSGMAESVDFRLKTITETRTLYSKSNTDRYFDATGAGAKSFWSAPGIKYWVFAQRNKSG